MEASTDCFDSAAAEWHGLVHVGLFVRWNRPHCRPHCHCHLFHRHPAIPYGRPCCPHGIQPRHRLHDGFVTLLLNTLLLHHAAAHHAVASSRCCSSRCCFIALLLHRAAAHRAAAHRAAAPRCCPSRPSAIPSRPVPPHGEFLGVNTIPGEYYRLFRYFTDYGIGSARNKGLPVRSTYWYYRDLRLQG
jgi:hypothetical protein